MWREVFKSALNRYQKISMFVNEIKRLILN